MLNPIGFKYFINVFKYSLLETFCNGKILFMFLIVVAILVGIWGNAMNIEWYNSAHGVHTLSNPRMEAIHLMMSVIAITAIIFTYYTIKRIIKELN
ncbi:hypothetical protein [Crassaminicella profunda]|uniref:hypothetical protein n=1 Tax=Crassaminicella profunda TaxID=1286698 RepID=UPI001CA74EEB|nr:hypothetical protein [Crassaminicella profunda]QZY53986.1 hypothetical protein K7H06_13085 [Crassaminicella profunda]